MDKTSFIGLLVGLGGILLGNILEGGHTSSLIQFPAFLIVFGGTLGAVMLNSTAVDLKLARELFKNVFSNEDKKQVEEVRRDIIAAANLARKESILAIEPKLKTYKHPMLQNVLRFVIDGIEPKVIKEIFEDKIYLEEERLKAGAKVYMDAGAYSPTIGIIGAVLGLIHIMGNLTDTDKLGSGIAVAFVATIYGVALANLLFIPMANKLKRKIQFESETKEMILTGSLAIMSGLNPYIIEEKISVYHKE